MNPEQIRAIFTETGAMLNGHFLLTSGQHSNQYFQCAQVLQYPQHGELLCQELARRIMAKGHPVQAVIAPATGGILVSYELARALGVRSLFAEREQGIMTLRRGFRIKPGEQVLVAEDVITTGGSVREVIAAVENWGGKVVAVAVLVNRSGGKADLGVPTEALINTDVVTYQPENCPLCQQGLPAVKPGSRK
ncbi:MAG: orotate phosphoribosyltransferase [Desulfotomaculum sp.]|nr:orotate phosphoribosyltransferase [Desulfotomaculum sp.]